MIAKPTAMHQTSSRSRGIAAFERPRVIELVGLAGSGKTTLLQALSQTPAPIVPGVQVSELQYVPIFLRQTLGSLAVRLQYPQASRWFTWKETRSMIYVEAWHRAVTQQRSNNPSAIVFDHGPLFRLARLRAFGPELTQSSRYQKWWNRYLDRWIDTLDLVVWLDAPDELLLQRIHARSTWHEVKESSQAEGYQFLSRYRQVYDDIHQRSRSNPHLRTLHFETHQKSTEQIAAEIFATLSLPLKPCDESSSKSY